MISHKKLKFIDTHAHLADESLKKDLSRIMRRSHDAGVMNIVTVADSETAWKDTIRIAQSHPAVCASLGVHPHDADRYTSPDLLRVFKRKLKKEAIHNNIAAIGETGLDYYKRYSDPVNQKNLFNTHLSSARELSLPLIIHCRQAYPDLIVLLKEFIPTHSGRKYPGVIHCFSGSLEDAEQLCALGFFLGVDGPITYPKSEILRNTIKNIPLDLILLETDCPYLAPQAFRGKQNEPSYIVHIAAELAAIKKIPLETVSLVTTANAQKLFNRGA